MRRSVASVGERVEDTYRAQRSQLHWGRCCDPGGQARCREGHDACLDHEVLHEEPTNEIVVVSETSRPGPVRGEQEAGDLDASGRDHDARASACSRLPSSVASWTPVTVRVSSPVSISMALA